MFLNSCINNLNDVASSECIKLGIKAILCLFFYLVYLNFSVLLKVKTFTSNNLLLIKVSVALLPIHS